MSSVDVPKTYGAVLIGGLFALGLSGIVTVQSLIYIKLYPDDKSRLKALVLATWVLDLCHSAFVISALWTYLISNYGNSASLNNIPWAVPMTIVFTAILTFCVHCFFANRVFMLSHRNYYITIPIIVLAVCRLTSACVTTGTMFHEGTLSGFKEHYKFVFTMGLALSSVVDLIITASLLSLLQAKRTGISTLDGVIDSLILYAFETGSLTCAATIASMICWLTMSNNLIFMGLHFVISKLYANSLLVTLNTRAKLRRARSGTDRGKLVILGSRRPNFHNKQPSGEQSLSTKIGSQPALQINVEKNVLYRNDQGDDNAPPHPSSPQNSDMGSVEPLPV